MPMTNHALRWMTLALAVGWACSGSTSPEEKVASLVLNKQTVALDAVGATEQLTAAPRDKGGAAVSGVTVSWSTSDANVAGVNASGQVTAIANGTATVTAAAGTARAEAAVTVAQAPRLAAVGGSGQEGTVGQPLPDSLAVEVADRLGNAIAGVAVSFTPDQSSSTASPAEATTGDDGLVRTSWTLGTKSGIQRLTAASAAGSASIVITAGAQAGPGASLGMVSGDAQGGPPGGVLAQPLVVKVTDQFGNLVAGHSVTFAVTTGGGSVDPAAATTGIDGRASTTWTLGPAEGPNTARAEATDAAAVPLEGSPVVFTAQASNAAMEVNDGDSQVGLVSKPVNVPPSVKVTAGGQPQAGVAVTFAVQSGGGSVSGAAQVTDTDGIARVGSWTLGGTTETNANTLTASASAGGSPLTFTATGETAQFDVEVRFLGTVDEEFKPAFTNAAARWELVVFGDLVDAIANFTAAQTDFCGQPGAIDETIDDIVIFARVDSIDNVGGVLARAGPCFIRDEQEAPDQGKPAIGRMVFDSADVRGLIDAGRWEDVILHEMGHVLGIGVLWDAFVVNPSCDFSQDPPVKIDGQDTHFNGPRAVQAFDLVGGKNFTGGKVPVENEQGTCEGTRDTHWRESALGSELMTGFLNPGSNPLSIVTLGSMWDQGFKVNYSDADAYQLILAAPPALVSGSSGGSGIALMDDVFRGPVFGISRGRVTRVIVPARLR